jgi:ketosteroid isomerase-like protein
MRLIAVLFASTMIAAAADAASDKDDVVGVVNKLFAGMASRDGDAIASTMTPDARLIADNNGKLGAPLRRDEFAQRLASGKNQVIERIWNPTVLVRGNIAMVWAEYDVHVGGKFNHCGIDAFMLLKTDAGWKISDITYTSETQDCKPSPLGPVTAK